MYESYFGLRELPFSLTPNTHYFLNVKTHVQALELLLVALRNAEGFIKISGEVGTGKTLLCRKLLNTLEDEFVTAYIANPQLTADQLYLAVAEELNVDVSGETGSHQVIKRLNEKLITKAQEGKKVVLVIDEAQAMPEPTIEALRLLTNLETESTKLLQVVLFGQPELDEMLNRPSLRQLQQRITFQQRLSALDQGACVQYLHHRLAQAGYNGPALFNSHAERLLYKASGGIPRLINILAHKSLISAYGRGEKKIRRKHVKLAIKDTESVRMPRFSRMIWSFAGVGLTGLLVLVFMVSQGGLG